MRAIKNITLFLIAAWFGLAVYFSAVVAPVAFSTLRSFELSNANEIAGTIVSRSLSVVNVSGFCLSVLLLLRSLVIRNRIRWNLLLTNFAFLILGVSTGAGEWLIAARMRALRKAMGGHIDQVPLTDPNHMAFTALHGYSVAALTIAMMAALLAALLIIVARERDQT